ncbi:WcbI family polysaccharide biosynthesis putative acetyltransferase [Brevundimonas sp.]|uniref:WcbI family polysaccharide biosynthesis putative acetyltransferase n=1 Tax=Brevundimonas sp. TaxID=1871086 RepID=UPI0037BEA0D4
MRIALVGLCQVVGMGDALKSLFPEAVIKHRHIKRNSEMQQAIADSLPSYDLVITQFQDHHDMPLFTEGRLLEAGVPRVEVVPPFIFRGFHPDSCLISGVPQTPIEAFHSKILSAAFSLGLPLDRAIMLFNKLVYKRLGYFEEFSSSRSSLMASYEPYGYDVIVERDWDLWLKGGAFMHTPLHPNVRVLSSLATFAVERSGIAPYEITPPSDVVDVFDQQHAWPFYTELAEEIGMSGDYTFRNYARNVAEDGDRFIQLVEFSKKSYEIFERSSRSAIDNDPGVIEGRDVLRDIIVN